jgi:twinkle protein
MGKVVKAHVACYDTEGCGSSDAMSIYDDGFAHCFACNKNFKSREDGDEPSHTHVERSQNKLTTKNNVPSILEIGEYGVRGFQSRQIKKATCEHFGVKVSIDSSTGEFDAHYYPYTSKGNDEIHGYKIRRMPKEFIVSGKQKGLFGANKVDGSSDKMIVIAEGEIDAMSIAQAWFNKYAKWYPVVTMGSASNVKELLNHREWIRSFDKVVLWFDNDEPGRKAVSEAARIIGYDKCYDVQSAFKDANEALLSDPKDPSVILNPIYSAKPFSPVGIVSSASTWDIYKKSSSAQYVPYPPFMETLNAKNYGRRMGSITLLTSGTGMGKTSWVKEDQFFLHKTRPADERIGVLSLEESVAEAVQNLMALEANKRIQLPDVGMTDEEERAYWEATMGSDRFMFLDHQGSMEDSSLVDKMEYMCLSGCKFLYLDHITIAVSESASAGAGDTNTAIDSLMSDLLKLAKRHDVWICVISHLRKTPNGQKSFEEGAVPSEDDLKGSGSLKQIPMQTFAISRNKMDKDPIKQNTSMFWVLKDRFTGRTGYVDSYRFDEVDGRCHRVDAVEESFEALDSE